MEELTKLEALWSEIRQSQYLTEENIKKIDDLIKELKELENSNSDYVNKLTDLYNITNELLLNLQSVNQNFNINVENLDKTIKNSINNINVDIIKIAIENKLNEFKNTIKNSLDEEIKKFRNNLSDLTLANDELRVINNKIKDMIEEFDEVKYKLNDKINSLNKKIAVFTFILGLVGGMAITFITTAYIAKRYHIKTITKTNNNNNKTINLVNKLKNENQILENENEELKEKIAELEKWQIPDKYRFNDNEYYYLGIPANDIEYYKNKKYCFVKLFKMKK